MSFAGLEQNLSALGNVLGGMFSYSAIGSILKASPFLMLQAPIAFTLGAVLCVVAAAIQSEVWSTLMLTVASVMFATTLLSLPLANAVHLGAAERRKDGDTDLMVPAIVLHGTVAAAAITACVTCGVAAARVFSGTATPAFLWAGALVPAGVAALLSWVGYILTISRMYYWI